MKHQVSGHLSPKSNGVLVADGYGIRISVERGRLVIDDGYGNQRQHRTLAKVGHGIRRLVIIGHTGTISLDAIRWLDRTGIHLTHIDATGTPLVATVNEGLGNSRLRRAQALAATTDTGLDISRYLLDLKLAGQATNLRTYLDNHNTADRIDRHRLALATADTIRDCVEAEAQAALDYFTAWNGNVAYRWANKDRDRLPDHWHTFTSRRSLVTRSSNNRASDPVNATLNYLYALAEIECRRACLILGLDPGLGFIHADVPTRDSLALDLIEAIRPTIDAHVLDLAHHRTFTTRHFTETDDGHVRLAAPLTHELADTLPTWEAAIAPIAEHVAHVLAAESPYAIAMRTPLTNTIRRDTATTNSAPRRKTPTAATPPRTRAKPTAHCVDCGQPLPPTATTYCTTCWPERHTEISARGREVAANRVKDTTHRARRNQAISTTKTNATLQAIHDLGHTPEGWEHLAPKVAALTLRQIMDATGLAISHASRIKTGKYRPHPRHWTALANASREAVSVEADSVGAEMSD